MKRSLSIALVPVFSAVTLLLLLLAAPGLQAQAEEDAVAGLPDRLHGVVFPARDARYPGVPAALDSAAAVAPSVQTYPWARMVAQSYRDDNWEIYYYNDDGSQPRRLTNSPAADVTPDLSRGGEYVVWASRVDEDYELFRMRADGSEVVRLTNNDADAIRPRFSPDGQKIIFEVDNGSSVQIWTMDSDGTNFQQLTHTGVVNGMPAWSFDGQKVAFITSRTGGFEVATMNADGSQQTVLTNGQGTWHKFYPAWSQNGYHIAYSANDYSGWLHLRRMESNGYNQSTLYNPGSFKDALVRGYAPTGDFIGFTLVNYVVQGNQLYWTSADAFGFNLQVNQPQGLTATGREWHADWKSIDSVPPDTQMVALPRFVKRGTGMLHWTSQDDFSGMRHVYVESRQWPDGAWNRDWELAGTTTSQPILDFNPGTYEYRIVGEDMAYNEESPDWQSTVRCTIYFRKISLTLLDNRGAPVLDQPEISVANSIQLLEFHDNQVDIYGDSSFDDVIATVAGYGVLPPTDFHYSWDDTAAIWVLPPADNVVDNGDFEPGTAGWQLGPDAVPAQIGHTGGHSLQLGPFPTAGSWSHWHDGLDAWAGQTVTLTLAVEEGDQLLSHARQQVVIPAAMVSPTLSLMVMVDSDQPSSGQRVVARLENSAGLSETLGVTALVPFQISTRIDEVSLGSAMADLALTDVGTPHWMLPGRPASYALEVANRGAVGATDLWLTYTLPTGFVFESASITPTVVTSTTLGFALPDIPAGAPPLPVIIYGTLAPGLTPGSSISGSAVLSSAMADLLPANNEREIVTWLGARVLLPFTGRLDPP